MASIFKSKLQIEKKVFFFTREENPTHQTLSSGIFTYPSESPENLSQNKSKDVKFAEYFSQPTHNHNRS